MPAENDRIDELRQHAEAGDDQARPQLASWLSGRRQIDEAITVIRPLAGADDEIAQLWLAGWPAATTWTSLGGVPGQGTITLCVTSPGGWPIMGSRTSCASC